MRVEFTKHEKNGRLACVWVATYGKNTKVPGSFMAAGAGLPHDLSQYVVEAAVGFRNGFWDLVGRGATFKSTGRRATKPGRAIIAEHRRDLDASERVAGEHMAAWQSGTSTDVTSALDRALEQWRSMRPGEVLVFDWPSPLGEVRRAAVAG